MRSPDGLYPPEALACMVSLALPMERGGGEVVEIVGVESEPPLSGGLPMLEVLPTGCASARFFSRHMLVGLTPAAREFLREVAL